MYILWMLFEGCLTLSECPAEDSDEQQQESRHREEDSRPQEPSRELVQKRRWRGHQLGLWSWTLSSEGKLKPVMI